MSSNKKKYKPCVTPCPHFITGMDSHELCVECLGVEHAKTALEEGACKHCLWLPLIPLITLHSRAKLFDESGKIIKPHGSEISLSPAYEELLEVVSWLVVRLKC